jgi:hypothetical protein
MAVLFCLQIAVETRCYQDEAPVVQHFSARSMRGLKLNYMTKYDLMEVRGTQSKLNFRCTDSWV